MESNSHRDFHCFHCFQNYKFSREPHLLSLARNPVAVIGAIHTSDLDRSYKLPFTELPNRVYLRNNKSAEAHRDFVNEAILDLVNSGRVCESIAPPYVVNSLSVSVQSNSGKK